MVSSSINSFDAVVLFITVVAVVMGFMTGMLRSLATILGYVAAAPVAMVATPPVAALLGQQSSGPAM
jgi:membrane protein required for colicin V production